MKRARRVAFGTNILVSALVFPGGRGEAALRRVIEQTDQLVSSRAIVDELLSVLADKFARDAEELAHVAIFITELSVMVAPKKRLRVVRDDADNRILECAAAGRAEVIVTGDKALLALGVYERIRILTLREYLGTT